MDKLKKISVAGFAICLIVASIFAMKSAITMEPWKWYGALFASDYLPLLNEFPSTSDADEANLIYKQLENAYPFKRSSLHAGAINLYWLPGNIHTVMTVFEIPDLNEQQKIIEVAHLIRRKFHTRRFSIEFYAKETGPNPKDQFLRKVRID